MVEHALQSPFWQSLAGSLLANAIFALILSAGVISFAKKFITNAWQQRQTIRLWITVPLVIYVGLLAVRYNTVSAKESTIRSLQSSVETLNKRLAHWRLSDQQKTCLVRALEKVPSGSVQIYANVGDGEAFNYVESLLDPLRQSRWKVEFAGSTPFPMPGLFVVTKKRVPFACGCVELRDISQNMRHGAHSPYRDIWYH